MKTLQHTYRPLVVNNNSKSIVRRFFDWCEKQEKDRLLWVGIAVGGHGCVFTPMTLLFIMLAGNSFVLWHFAIGAMAMSLIVNLAALPTKITIPILFLSLAIDLVIIVQCIGIGLAG